MAKTEQIEGNPYDAGWSIIYQWWTNLQLPKNSGPRAELRRAKNPDSVAMQRSYLSLYRDLYDSEIPIPVKMKLGNRLPLVAGILSHVKNNSETPVAHQMSISAKAGSDRPMVSELRFRRLMKTKENESLYIMMIRMVRLMNEQVNVKNLAESVLFWNDMTRKKWASQYYLKKDIYLK